MTLHGKEPHSCRLDKCRCWHLLLKRLDCHNGVHAVAPVADVAGVTAGIAADVAVAEAGDIAAAAAADVAAEAVATADVVATAATAGIAAAAADVVSAA